MGIMMEMYIHMYVHIYIMGETFLDYNGDSNGTCWEYHGDIDIWDTSYENTLFCI